MKTRNLHYRLANKPWRLDPRGFPVFHKMAHVMISQQTTCLRINMETFGDPLTVSTTREHANTPFHVMMMMMMMVMIMMTLAASQG